MVDAAIKCEITRNFSTEFENLRSSFSQPDPIILRKSILSDLVKQYTMLEWSSFTPQLIIAIIGILGSLLLFYASDWYSESKLPNVNAILPISPYYNLVSGNPSERGHIILNLVNTGKQAANNIVFTLETFNNDILNTPKISGNEKWDLVNSSSRSIILDVPRLSVGGVPMITIDLKMKNHSKNTDYKAAATFDEGSTQVSSSEIWSNSLIFYIYKAISDVLVVVVLVTIVGITLYFGKFVYSHYVWPTQQEKRNFLLRLSNDIIGIRSIFRNDESNGSFIPTSNNWYSLGDKRRRTFFKTAEEYISADDFYAKLKVRNSKIESLNNEELKGYNKECMCLADKASKNISFQKSSLANLLRPRLVEPRAEVQKYLKVASKNDLQKEGILRVRIEERYEVKELLLLMVEGKVYAIDYFCTHQGGPLGKGELKGTV